MIAQAGIDSWSPAWYVDRDSSAARTLDVLAQVPATRGMLLAEPIDGHRVGWNGAVGLLYAEGRPGGTEEVLVAPDALPARLSGLVAALREYGVPVPEGRYTVGRSERRLLLPDHDDLPGFAGVRRFDATVDVESGSQGRGLAILAGVAALATSCPRGQADVRYAKDATGAVETVYVRGHSGVKILGRWYDKGIESARAQRGRLVRAEDQRRFAKGHRRGVEELTNEYVRAKFCDRFLPLWQASKGVTVAGHAVLAEKIVERANSGEIGHRLAKSLVGELYVAKLGLRQPKSTRNKHRKVLREHGLVVADGAIEEVEVDLREVLEEALDGAHWGAQG